MSAVQKQKEYHISHIGQDYGPWTLDEVVDRLARMELLATDFIYDETTEEWIELSDYEPVQALIKAKSKPKAKPTKKLSPSIIEESKEEIKIPLREETVTQLEESILAKSIITNEPVPETKPKNKNETKKILDPGINLPAGEWYIQRDSHRQGPLTHLAVVKMLQEKKCFEYEFIWKEGMSDWVRIAEHPEFSAGFIRELMKSEALIKIQNEIFLARKYPRKTFMNEVMVSDDKSVWMGQSFQAGEGGSGLIIQNARLSLGQKLKFHFSENEQLPSFNVMGEIVCKKFVRGLRSPKQPVPYGVKFLDMESQTQSILHDFFTLSDQQIWQIAGK